MLPIRMGRVHCIRMGQDALPARIRGLFRSWNRPMIELNPVRQRIADLVGRLDALRGYL